MNIKAQQQEQQQPLVNEERYMNLEVAAAAAEL